MEEKIYKEVISEVLSNDNKRINDEWTLEEYLESFTIKQLTIPSVVYFWENRNYSELHKIRNMATKKKEYVISYILENITGIIETYIKILTSDIIKQLKEVVETDEIISYELLENKFNLQFLVFLKRNALARVYYDKKTNNIKIYIPKEFKNMIKDALKNKSIVKENKKYNEIYKFTINCSYTYGVLSMEELYSLCVKFNLKIDEEELNIILNSYSFIDEEFALYSFDNNTLIANLEFSNLDEVFDFYENSKKKLNNKLTFNDIKEIGENKYIYRLKSYKKLIDWLDERHENIKNDSNFLDELIIMDYIYTAQISLETANKNFKRNIDKILEIGIYDKATMLKMMEKIFLEYPKWNKRGNI